MLLAFGRIVYGPITFGFDEKPSTFRAVAKETTNNNEDFLNPKPGPIEKVLLAKVTAQSVLKDGKYETPSELDGKKYTIISKTPLSEKIVIVKKFPPLTWRLSAEKLSFYANNTDKFVFHTKTELEIETGYAEELTKSEELNCAHSFILLTHAKLHGRKIIIVSISSIFKEGVYVSSLRPTGGEWDELDTEYFCKGEFEMAEKLEYFFYDK